MTELVRRLARRRGAIGRAGWAMADQALSSLTNFVLAVVVARAVDPEGFGAFALMFAVYVITLTVSRAVSTDALVIRFSAAEPTAWRSASSDATGMAIVFGIVSGLGVGVVAFFEGGTVGTSLTILAIFLPVLLLQDAWRYVFFAAGTGRQAFINDGIWSLALFVAISILHALTEPTMETLIGAWGAGAGVGAVFGIAQARVLPRPGRALAWSIAHRDLAPRLALEGIVLSGAQYVTLLAVTMVAGLTATGAIRAGQVLMNALHVTTYGIVLFAVPEAVRIVQSSRSRMMRFCAAVAGGLGVVACGWGGLLLLLPADVGTALLGETWALARSVILPLTIVAAAAGVQGGALVGLRALALSQRSLVARLVTSGLMVTGGVIGAVLGGAEGTAWGMAVALVVGACTWWYQLRAERDGKPKQTEGLR